MLISHHIQRSPFFCANIVKKDPGRARQNSLATAGTNFTKPGAQNKGDLCSTKKCPLFDWAENLDLGTPDQIQGSANPRAPGCENALGKFRQKW